MLLNKLTKLTIAIAAGLFIAIGAASADDTAEAYVGGILVEADPVFNAATEQELHDGIAALVNKYVNMRRVGLFTLGQYARQLSDTQKTEYLDLFKQYATLVYQKSLSNYSGQRLEVTGSIDRSERDIIVTSKISNPAPGDAFADTVIQWRVYRSKSGDMSVVDAGADNIWLAIEQRSQFTSVIANNGGGSAGIDALIEQLREQVGS